ncbi:ATP-binding cassette sub-family G member 1-like isoform X2 [Periplaneta americana]
MLPLLTTYEILMTAADLKLGTTVKNVKKTAMINAILDTMGLKKTKNTLVKNLSGGEKKRLSIACELLTNPPVMFFDEPTSGLDSVSSMQVISHLKSLAQSGRTVVCSIHQPSSQLFELFDDLYLLAEGECAYSGPIDEMMTVFEDAGFTCSVYYNRADFALEVVTKEKYSNVEKLIRKNCIDFSQSDTTKNVDEACKENSTLLYSSVKDTKETILTLTEEKSLESNELYPSSSWLQFIILTKRSILCSLRDMYLTYVRISSYIAVGLLFGALGYNSGNEASKIHSNVGCIFFNGVFLFLLSPVLTVLVFPMEASVFLHEHHNNWYSLKSYYFSKIVADTPLQVLCATLFLIGSYFLTDQPLGIRAIQFWALHILLSLCGQALGFVAGAAFDAQMGLFMVISVAVPLFLFSGFYVRLNDVPGYLEWLTHVSSFRYSFEGGIVAIYGNNRSKLECSQPYCHYRNSSKILDDFNMSDATYENDLLAIVIWYFIMQIMFYIVLKLRLYISK